MKRLGRRRWARQLALQGLYAGEVGGCAPQRALHQLPVWQWVDEEIGTFADQLTTTVTDHLDEIDRIIAPAMEHWNLDRIALIDKNIMRLAVCEMAFFAEIPLRVSINEAIELAKKYGADQSGSFVNGVLDSIALKLNPKPAGETA